MERKLIHYLPYVVRDYREFQGITQAEQPEFEQAWGLAEGLLDNQFIHTASNLGLSRWEKILNIVPKGSDSVTVRRVRILARLNEQLPYTLPQLRRMLDTLCGAGNCQADVTDYTLLVTLSVAAKKHFDEVHELLERITPMNLVIDQRQLLNTHSALSQFTHAQLSVYTHSDLRNEVLAVQSGRI